MPFINTKNFQQRFDSAMQSSSLRRFDSATNLNRGISDLEQKQIHDLRTLLPKLTTNKFDDGYILRWLRSKDGRFDEAADGLRKNIVFRKAWDLDRISGWTAPEVCF